MIPALTAAALFCAQMEAQFDRLAVAYLAAVALEANRPLAVLGSLPPSDEILADLTALDERRCGGK